MNELRECKTVSSEAEPILLTEMVALLIYQEPGDRHSERLLVDP